MRRPDRSEFAPELDERTELVDADSEFFFQNELIKDRENSFAIAIHAPQRVAKIIFVTLRVQPFIQNRAGHVDVSAKIIGRVTTQEETIKDGGFPLWGKRIDIFGSDHGTSYETVSYYEIRVL